LWQEFHFTTKIIMTNTAIIGLQWGDEGKGKIVDFLANDFDAVVRFQGGNNAGHTIKVANNTYKLSLLPSGIIAGKLCIIGSGVVLDPVALFNEINKVQQSGIEVSKNNLLIASNCPLILSLHRSLDILLEEQKGNKKIGTTGRGIGPAYEDKVGRRALLISDLFCHATTMERLQNLVFYHNLIRSGLNVEPIKIDAIIQELEPIKQQLLSFVESPFEIAKTLVNKKILFEGAQGALLDISYGTYPFVTSSNTMAGQIALGSCLGVDSLHKTLGILKAYTTRVGSGPFPSELNNDIGEFLRQEGAEFGTVTGRNRRCGWFDVALVKQAIQLCSVKEVALTKLDVLDKLPIIKIVTGYKINGKQYDYLPQNPQLWQNIEPIYQQFEGWQSSTKGLTSFNNLPKQAINYLKTIESLCSVKISIISTGPSRNETIIC
jgi:adenylosuccinate synthase